MSDSEEVVSLESYRQQEEDDNFPVIEGDNFGQAYRDSGIAQSMPVWYEGHLYTPTYFGCIDCMRDREDPFEPPVGGSIFEYSYDDFESRFICGECDNDVKLVTAPVEIRIDQIPMSFLPTNNINGESVLGFVEKSKEIDLSEKKDMYAFWKANFKALMKGASLINFGS